MVGGELAQARAADNNSKSSEATQKRRHQQTSLESKAQSSAWLSIRLSSFPGRISKANRGTETVRVVVIGVSFQKRKQASGSPQAGARPVGDTQFGRDLHIGQSGREGKSLITTGRSSSGLRDREVV